MFDSPAKTEDELEVAIQLGVVINADNESELSRIDRLLRKTQRTTRIGLRINPQVGGGTIATTSVANIDSKFGFPISQREEIVQLFGRYRWLNGLHAHVGSQGCDPQMLIDSTVRLLELREGINAHTNSDNIDYIDVGGGLPVAYHSEQRPITIEGICPAIESPGTQPVRKVVDDHDGVRSRHTGRMRCRFFAH